MTRVGLLTTCCVLAAALGCQQSAPPAPNADPPRQVTRVSTGDSKTPVVKTPQASPTDSQKPASAKGRPKKDTKHEKKPDRPSSKDRPSDTQVDHPFEPPFGERVEMFLPPERAQVNVQRPSSSVASVPDVTLKGFVKVGKQRAVLLIGEEVSFLAEGQEKEGIQVISIEPPLVTLQLGRNRWTVSLFEDR